jgi:hypothetical protein
MRPLLLAGAAFAALLSVGCAAKGASVEQLMSRGTFDFECPRLQLRVMDLGDRQRGMIGCGKRLTYIEVCENRIDGWHCAWVINGPQWQHGPSANKRPPTPEQAFFYTTPPPGASTPGAPTAAPPPAPTLPPGPPLAAPVPVAPIPVAPAPAPPVPAPVAPAPAPPNHGF